MKTRKIISAFLGFLMLLSLVLVPTETVNATTQNEAVLDARNGIVQVMYSAENFEGEVVDLYGGTGFLIGEKDVAPQYVITNHHVVDPFHVEYTNVDLEKQSVWDFLGVPYDQEIKVVIRIVLKRDTYIEAEIVNSSMSADFAILKLEQPVYGDRKPLVLADSSELKETEDVYALGFPAIVQAMQDSQLYTSTDVTINDGKVSKLADSVLIDNPIPCINHSATITSGNSGGPLVNANGEVVGINRHTDVTGTYFYSVQINEISEVLDLTGIPYEKAGESAEETPISTEESETVETVVDVDTPAEDNSALFDELKEMIDEAKTIDLTIMTEESVLNFEDALQEAKDVYNDANADKEDLEDAMDNLEIAAKGLVEAPKGLSPVVIISIVAAVVIVIAAVIILVVLSSKKKQKAAEKEKQKRAAQNMNQRPINQTPIYPQNPVSTAPMMDDGADATGVLNDGSTETTVLGGATVPTAYLMRKKNNERIAISKQIFKLGKERRKVDYCVADNTNVSRTHADIVYKNGEFYVLDRNATNGTYVNGASVAAGQEKVLKNGDIIKLADEEFQFRTL